jgi:ADP-heptose:LPS heptosyltransferase
LADFAPLGAVARDGLQLISLQLGPRCDELIAPPRGLRLTRLLDDSAVVADTAAIMRTLDLVITVDTMTAHLAGALGTPVWVLAAAAPAWWLWHERPPDAAAPAGSVGSRWYPSMRIVRQRRAGEWVEVMARVCDALRVAP